MTKFDFSLENIAFSFVIFAVGMLESLIIIVLYDGILRNIVLFLWNTVIGYVMFRNLRGDWQKW